MGVVKLRVDATGGVRVRVGERIEEGAVIGGRREKEVVADCAGVVESVTFDGEKHEFEVIVRPE